jgi:hypothetical protein
MPYRRQIIAVSELTFSLRAALEWIARLTLFFSSWQTDTGDKVRQADSRRSHARTDEIY